MNRHIVVYRTIDIYCLDSLRRRISTVTMFLQWWTMASLSWTFVSINILGGGGGKSKYRQMNIHSTLHFTVLMNVVKLALSDQSSIHIWPLFRVCQTRFDPYMIHLNSESSPRLSHLMRSQFLVINSFLPNTEMWGNGGPDQSHQSAEKKKKIVDSRIYIKTKNQAPVS